MTVGLPNVKGREEILKVHSKSKKLDEGVLLNVIAKRTPGFSGAKLVNRMNEAAIFSWKKRKDRITIQEIESFTFPLIPR